MVLNKVQSLLNIERLEDPDIPGYQVSLHSVVAWQLRELRLHGKLNNKVNLKLDGRPFFGRNIFGVFHYNSVICLLIDQMIHIGKKFFLLTKCKVSQLL